MVHEIFDPNSVTLDDYVFQLEHQQQQIGSGEFNYFRGIPPYQRGYGRQRGGGVGDVLRNLWRVILPGIKTVGSWLGREALATGGRLLDSAEKGEISKPAIVTEIKKGVDNVLEKSGVGRQLGTGIRGRRKGIKRKRIIDNESIIGKTIPKKLVKKRKRSDVFGGLF